MSSITYILVIEGEDAGTMLITEKYRFLRPARYRTLATMGPEVLLVGDPEKYPFGFPTRQKPAHLNSACYDTDGRILVTLFHQPHT